MPQTEPTSKRSRWPHWTERLAAGVTRRDSGCLEWTASTNNKGYGVIWFDGKLRLTHRAAWLHHYGEWPTPGLVVDHICNNTRCVEISHLRLLTNGANIMRAYPRGDAQRERIRANNRRANAKRRNKIRVRGESDFLV